MSNKTIVIIIAAIAAICCCWLVSCCAGTLFVLSRQSVEETVQDYYNNGSDQPILENAEPAATATPVVETETVKETVEETVEEAVPTETATEEAVEAEAAPTEEAPVEMKVEITAEPVGETRPLSEVEEFIIDMTEMTRELSTDQKFAPVYLTTDELREQLMNDINAETDEEYAKENGLLRILGFVPENFDLKQFYVDLYAEQIAGFYDTEKNQMYLMSDLSDYENATTLAHEYTHYLQYNTPKFAEGLNLDSAPDDEYGERSIIISALVEGDATLVEALLDTDDLLEDYDEDYDYDDDDYETSSDVFDSAPKYFQDDLLFPYYYGFDFVWYMYAQGGWDAVNKLYENVPESVEQIMHPEKYLKDHPVDINPEPFRSAIVKDEKDIIAETVLNEADILQLFTSGYKDDWRISDRQAAVAAEGWGGGYYLYTSNADGELLFAKTVWDSEYDAEEAETAFKLYSDARFETAVSKSEWKDADGSSVYLIRQDDILYWMILPEGFNSADILDLINNGVAM